MLVSAVDTTAIITDNVQRAGLTDFIYCITSFEKSHSYLLWYSHNSFVVRSNEFNFCRLIGQAVFEETIHHFLFVLLLMKYAVFSTNVICLKNFGKLKTKNAV